MTRGEMIETAHKLARGVNERTLPGYAVVVTAGDAVYEVSVRKLKLGVDYDKEEEESLNSVSTTIRRKKNDH